MTKKLSGWTNKIEKKITRKKVKAQEIYITKKEIN